MTGEAVLTAVVTGGAGFVAGAAGSQRVSVASGGAFQVVDRNAQLCHLVVFPTRHAGGAGFGLVVVHVVGNGATGASLRTGHALLVELVGVESGRAGPDALPFEVKRSWRAERALRGQRAGAGGALGVATVADSCLGVEVEACRAVSGATPAVDQSQVFPAAETKDGRIVFLDRILVLSVVFIIVVELALQCARLALLRARCAFVEYVRIRLFFGPSPSALESVAQGTTSAVVEDASGLIGQEEEALRRAGKALVRIRTEARLAQRVTRGARGLILGLVVVGGTFFDARAVFEKFQTCATFALARLGPRANAVLALRVAAVRQSRFLSAVLQSRGRRTR